MCYPSLISTVSAHLVLCLFCTNSSLLKSSLQLPEFPKCSTQRKGRAPLEGGGAGRGVWCEPYCQWEPGSHGSGRRRWRWRSGSWACSPPGWSAPRWTAGLGRWTDGERRTEHTHTHTHTEKESEELQQQDKVDVIIGIRGEREIERVISTKGRKYMLWWNLLLTAAAAAHNHFITIINVAT